MFTRAHNALSIAIESDECVVRTLERRFDELKLRWNEVQLKHDEYISTLDGRTDEEIQKEDVWIDELAKTFYNVEEETDKLLTNSVVKTDLTEKPTKSTDVKSSVQLERMKLKKFEGNIRKYPRFKEEFLKHVMPLCDKSQLSFVLRSYVSEEICEDIENIGDDFNGIWKRLDEKYGNIGKLIDTIMGEIKDLSMCSMPYSVETLNLITIIEKAYRDLDRLDQRHQLDNATILAMIERKLPDEITNEWIKIVTSDNHNYNRTFDLLMDLLSQWKSRIEYKLAAIRNVDSSSTNQLNRNTFYGQGAAQNGSSANHLSGNTFYGQGTAQNERYSSRQRCWIHVEEGGHPIWRCREFQERPVAERIELTKLNRACFSCLQIGHTIDNCPRRFRCNKDGCNQRHNSLLHNPSSSRPQTGDSQSNSTSSALLQIQQA